MSNKKEQARPTMLMYGDTGTCATGFGTVMKHIVAAESSRFDIHHLGINYHGDFYDQNEYRAKLYPAYKIGVDQDLLGRNRLLLALSANDPMIQATPEIFFTLQDSFIVEPLVPQIKQIQEQYKALGAPFVWVGYYPVDSQIKGNWADAIMAPDIPVVYTEFGKREVLRFDPLGEKGWAERLRVIPHGVDRSIFHPLPKDESKAFRDEYFKGKVGGKFLVANVNRNQPRKDIARTMAVFAEFHKRQPDSFLYLHMAVEDAGGNLAEVARYYGLQLGDDWGYPANFDPNQGMPIETVNKVYNAADAVITTTLGEGWGLSITESMAAGTIVVAPHNTSVPEIMGNQYPNDFGVNEAGRDIYWPNRGVSVECGGTSLWTCLGPSDWNNIRPLTDVNAMAKALQWVYDNPESVQEVETRASEYVKTLNWDREIKEMWNKVFDDAEALLKERRTKAQMNIRANKNLGGQNG